MFLVNFKFYDQSQKIGPCILFWSVLLGVILGSEAAPASTVNGGRESLVYFFPHFHRSKRLE